jgi:hypothetical protein
MLTVARQAYRNAKMWTDLCANARSLAVVGGTRTGKTALVYDILSFSDKPVYVFKHPRPELIEALGFHNLQGLGEVEFLQDCILFLDEPQLYITLSEKKANHVLQNLLSLCGQRNVLLIMSTSETRFITRGLEAYIEVYLIKDIDVDYVKQGSQIKKIVKDAVYVSLDGFRLTVPQFIFYSRRFNAYNGIKTFDKPDFFTDELSKPYRITALESAPKLAEIKVI